MAYCTNQKVQRELKVLEEEERKEKEMEQKQKESSVVVAEPQISTAQQTKP